MATRNQKIVKFSDLFKIDMDMDVCIYEHVFQGMSQVDDEFPAFVWETEYELTEECKKAYPIVLNARTKIEKVNGIELINVYCIDEDIEDLCIEMNDFLSMLAGYCSERLHNRYIKKKSD